MSADHLFKKGNKEWERRSRHGRARTFKSAKLLLEAFLDYVQWNEDNPFFETKPMVTSNGPGEGSSVELVPVPKMRPLTLISFCTFCGTHSEYWRVFKSQLVVNRNTTQKQVNDFKTVIKMIEDSIYNQKLSGAAAGFFNANIIARDLGLTEKTENKNQNTNINSVSMSKEEMIELSKKLDEDV